MKTHKRICIAAICLFWAVVVCLLLVGAAQAPRLTSIEKPRAYTYHHEADGYTLQLQGTWQVASIKDKQLTLCNLDHNGTIDILLEVGGYDYESLEALGERLRQTLEQTCPDGELGTIKPASHSVYDGVTMLGILPHRGQEMAVQASILWINHGLRCYILYAFPPDLDDDAIGEGLQIIASLTFQDLEDIYEKYLKSST